MKKIKYSNSRLLLNQKGFSLIELIIILVIIGIMIAASSSRLKDITTNARVGASINQITGDIDQAKTISMSLRSQIQIIFIEFIIVGLVLWQHFDKSLTFESTLFYTILYVLCMIGWFWFRGNSG